MLRFQVKVKASIVVYDKLNYRLTFFDSLLWLLFNVDTWQRDNRTRANKNLPSFSAGNPFVLSLVISQEFLILRIRWATSCYDAAIVIVIRLHKRYLFANNKLEIEDVISWRSLTKGKSDICIWQTVATGSGYWIYFCVQRSIVHLQNRYIVSNIKGNRQCFYSYIFFHATFVESRCRCIHVVYYKQIFFLLYFITTYIYIKHIHST